MTDSLYRYYEQELRFIRQQTQSFAELHPAAASRLLLEPNRSADPHVERLIESFALLTARIQKKLDDDFPELTTSLLETLYPHYLAPAPSMSIVQLDPEPSAMKPEGVTIPRHSRMRSQKVAGSACRFRTCYPVTLWPLELESARMQTPPFPRDLRPPHGAAAILRLKVSCLADARIDSLDMEWLRFHLYGENQLTAQLYELLFNHVVKVELRPGDDHAGEPLVLDPEDCLRQVGFELDEGLLPYPPQSSLGYRLLTECFSFPEKFAFFDLGGWDQAAAARFGKDAEVVIYFDRSLPGREADISTDTFRLHCTPIINLFERICEPIRLDYRSYEHRVRPDVDRPLDYEVYNIARVTSADREGTREYKPLYEARYDSPWSPADDDEAYFTAVRRSSSQRDDDASDVYLQLVDRQFQPAQPAEAVLTVRALCTNRNLPQLLQHCGEGVRFDLEAAEPVRQIHCLKAPTSPLRPPLGRRAHWRLISHLKLNHLSLNDPDSARGALQEMLRLYDFSAEGEQHGRGAINRQLIEGIVGVSSRPVVRRIGGGSESGFCRGVEILVELDEEKYYGFGSLLFASVLERFFGLYASLNSFTQLAARRSRADEPFKRWPPRIGEAPLL
ncbi:type VI secretion system baseplate subunit TssF [Lignipirellula cremea]|uniref:Type VI secretion system baseplate subunit TssF n=1 Tax=Lignipirellula cremea TaxID=2528010 RepID=A0A518DT53_9BACT|nr:type VI secretion system baseplate subunit TssF [Lignipirellula cremea]QDU95004.1 hypothetical protein Pla8534_28140 [Lignipirellula cremea]